MTSVRRLVAVFFGVMVTGLLVGLGCNGGIELQNGLASCRTDSDCPSDYHCATTLTCWRNGTDPVGDAAVGPPCKTTCGGACVDTASDRAHCGACDKKCADGEVCSQGACALSCGGGTRLCRQGCRDTNTDGENCGACDTVCGAGRACVKGACVSACADGLTTCVSGGDGGSLYCANTATDNTNCGGCGKVCGPGLACKAGVCSTTCGGGDTLCPAPTGSDGGAAFCSNLKVDRRNCGACGVECTSGLLCSNGTCAVSCQANLVECAGTCVDPNASRAFCGATPGCGAAGGSAGTACAEGNVCSNGVCKVSCPGTQINCGGTCIDPQTSRTQCGATGACGAGGNGSAGTACAAGNVCANGVCTVSCPGTQINCGGTCVEPATSRAYCGATGACGAGGGSAGTACAPGNVCANGTCQVSCPGGQINCGGVCTDPLTSRGFCGATGACGAGGNGSPGSACSAGSVCANGTCQVSCPGLQINCGGTCVDPLTSRSNCGATGACGAGGNGSPGAVCGGGNVCAGGSCQVSCPGTQINCGGTCVDPLTNRANCGATGACGAGGNGSPGAACPVGNVCSSGSCQVSCPGAQINCGGVCVDPATSAANCGATGACGAGGNGSPGAVCGAGKVCTSGVCQASCQLPLIACSGSCVDPRFDPGHCNGCSPCPAVANATNFCANSACGIATCATNFNNCNGLVADGCESNRLTDNNNCGACGVVCSGGTPICSGGVCIAVPQPTFLWLDATDAATITKDGGNNVSQWRDKSGLGRHANQGATAPVWAAAGGPNGNPAILFNGATVRMATAPVPTSADMTIFVVFNMITTMNWGSLINQAHDTYFSIRRSDCCGGNGNLNFHIQNNNGAPLQPITYNSWKIVTAMRQGTTSTFYYVGGPVTQHNGDTLTGGINVPVTIGNAQSVGESMGGYLAEIRAFASALTAGQRSAVENNLKSKYGL